MYSDFVQHTELDFYKNKLFFHFFFIFFFFLFLYMGYRTILPGDINTIRLFSRDHYWITLDEKTYFIPSKIGIIHSRRLTEKKVTSWFPKSSHFKVQSGNKEYVLVEMQYYFFFILTCVQKDKNELLFSNEEKQFLFGVLGLCQLII